MKASTSRVFQGLAPEVFVASVQLNQAKLPTKKIALQLSYPFQTQTSDEADAFQKFLH